MVKGYAGVQGGGIVCELEIQWREIDRYVAGCVGSCSNGEEDAHFPVCHEVPREGLVLAARHYRYALLNGEQDVEDTTTDKKANDLSAAPSIKSPAERYRHRSRQRSPKV